MRRFGWALHLATATLLSVVAVPAIAQEWVKLPLPYPCGVGTPATKFKVKLDKATWSQPAPLKEGYARLYVLGDGNSVMEAGVNYGFAINGKWVGATARNRSYFMIDLVPGEYRFCASGAWFVQRLRPGFLKVRLEAGKTYYVATVYPVNTVNSKIEQLDEEAAQQQLRYSHRTTLVSPTPEWCEKNTQSPPPQGS